MRVRSKWPAPPRGPQVKIVDPRRRLPRGPAGSFLAPAPGAPPRSSSYVPSRQPATPEIERLRPSVPRRRLIPEVERSSSTFPGAASRSPLTRECLVKSPWSNCPPLCSLAPPRCPSLPARWSLRRPPIAPSFCLIVGFSQPPPLVHRAHKLSQQSTDSSLLFVMVTIDHGLVVFILVARRRPLHCLIGALVLAAPRPSGVVARCSRRRGRTWRSPTRG